MRRIAAVIVAMLAVMFVGVGKANAVTETYAPSNGFPYCAGYVHYVGYHSITDHCFDNYPEYSRYVHRAKHTLMVLFMDNNHKGIRLSLLGSRTCYQVGRANQQYFINSMPYGWNDVVSSFYLFDQSCVAMLYHDIRIRGREWSYGCGPGVNKIPVKGENDTLSSMQFLALRKCG